MAVRTLIKARFVLSVKVSIINKLPKDKQEKAKQVIQKETERINKTLALAIPIVKDHFKNQSSNIKMQYFSKFDTLNYDIVQGNFLQYYVRLKTNNINIAYGTSKEVFDGVELNLNKLKEDLNSKLKINTVYAFCKNLTEGTTVRIGFDSGNNSEIKL